MIIDPVCGMHVDPENAPAFFTYQEHTYYFCCDKCMRKFRSNPDHYVELGRELNPQGYGDQGCPKSA